MGEMVKGFPSEGNGGTPSQRGRQGSESPSGEAAGRAASEMKQAASQVAGQAKDLVTREVTEQAGRSARDLLEVARALRQTRQQLQNNMAAPFVDRAADQIDRLSSFLRDANPSRIARDVENFARREPLLFLGGAFALGMLGARFLKSSAHHVESEGWSTRERRERGYGESVGRPFSRGESGSSWYQGQRPGRQDEEPRMDRPPSQGAGPGGSA